MAVLVCRVAWMPSYRLDDESAKGGGSYIDEGNVPHEGLNFLLVGDVYYGFVEHRGHRLSLKELGGQTADETISGVSVVYCAEEPESGDFLIVGWYADATVHRHPIGRPDDVLGRTVYFTAKSATLVVESERCFRVPRSKDNPRSPFGGVGQSHVWYGLNGAEAAGFRESLFEYMATLAPTQVRAAAVESRRRRISEKLERRGTYRQFIRTKGYRCEACEWSIEKVEEEVWGSSFELHHLTPFSELEEGASRMVRIEDFGVLCTSCHRAIHRTDCVSDVARFSRTYICD